MSDARFVHALALGLDAAWRRLPATQRCETAEDLAVRRATHRTIDRVGAELERWSYNTAVAHCMELVNTLQRYVKSADGPHVAVLDEDLRAACTGALAISR